MENRSMFGEAKVHFGTVRKVAQNEMTAECWGVQLIGLEECMKCQFKNTKDCGGKKIRKTGKNEKGFKIPLGVKEVD